jgi:hypothetical protein
VNNLTLEAFYNFMIGRADIEGSKSNVAMNAWLPQISYPCGKFSDTPRRNSCSSKGSIGHAFTIHSACKQMNKAIFSPFSPHKISVLIEITLGHLWWLLTDVPPQPNSQPVNVLLKTIFLNSRARCQGVSSAASNIVVFHLCRSSHIRYTA